MRRNATNNKELYENLKVIRDQHMPLWEKIAAIIAITVTPRLENQVSKGVDKDTYVDDPTAAISVNQAGDYLHGIIWGTGEDVFSLEPSDYALELANGNPMDKYFAWATKRLLGQMNHANAGLNTALKPYCYDQVGLGTSGIGAFPNQAFDAGREDNVLIYRNYGVDGLVIDEGKNGKVDIVFAAYRWRINRIVNEFCSGNEGEVDAKAFNRLPKKLQEAYNDNAANDEFTIVLGVIPRHDYNPRLKGKRGTRYRGTWFLEDEPNDIFYEEDFKTLPIAICRAILLRGDVYGRSSGTLITSTIMAVNFMVGKVIEVVEKHASPSLGMWSDALMGDKVLDSSADGLNVFNAAFAGGNGKNPIFPLYDVGDPSEIIKFLLPYLNEKIATAFKIDLLLDFADDSSKTATEMLQRSVIRGKSLAGILQQQKDELLIPLIDRSASVMQEKNMLGVNPLVFNSRAKQLAAKGATEQIIPDAVLQCQDMGKPWYKIRFNNELEKLTRTERLEALLKMLQVITAMMAVYPAIAVGIKWHELLMAFKDALNIQGDFLLSADEFQEEVRAQAERMAQQMAIQAGVAGSEIGKNVATAKKDNATAKSMSESGR